MFSLNFYFLNLGSAWFYLVVYKVSIFYHAWNWSKSLVWWVVVILGYGLGLGQADFILGLEN